MREKSKNCAAKLGLNEEKRPAPQRNTTAESEKPSMLGTLRRA